MTACHPTGAKEGSEPKGVCIPGGVGGPLIQPPQRATGGPDSALGTLGLSGRAETLSQARGLRVAVGCGLQDQGRALSFSQRSLLKVSVTRDSFSRSQCLGTLCLKGEGGKKSEQEKRGRSFLLFLLGLTQSHRGFPVARTRSGSQGDTGWALLCRTPGRHVPSPDTFLRPHLPAGRTGPVGLPPPSRSSVFVIVTVVHHVRRETASSLERGPEAQATLPKGCCGFTYRGSKPGSPRDD